MNPRIGLTGLMILFLPGCSGPDPVPGLAAVLRLLPEDSDFIVSVEIPDIASSPLGDAVFAPEAGLLPEGWDEGPGRMFDEAGVEIRSDVARVGVAGQLGISTPHRFVAVLAGRFPRDSMLAWLERESVSRSSYRGVDVYSLILSPEEPAGGDIHVAIPAETLVWLGDPELVGDSLDLYQGFGQGVFGSAAWSDWLERVDPGGSAWMISTSGRPAKVVGDWLGGLQSGIRIRNPLAGIEALIGEVWVKGELEIRVQGFLSDPDRAGQVAENLKAARAILRQRIWERNPFLGSVLDSFRLEADGATVVIEGAIPVDWEEEREEFEAEPDDRRSSSRPAHPAGSSAPPGASALRSTSLMPSFAAIRMLFSSR